MAANDDGNVEQRDNEQRGMRQRDGSSSQMDRGGQVRYYGDRAWHRATDAWGNPVWYRSFGWSYSSGDQAGRAGEQEPHEHGRTTSRHYQRSNERIRNDVYDRLNDHPNVDSSDIEVRVNQGIVTLEGTVHDRREKRLAEDIAESVSGVRDVQNNLKAAQLPSGNAPDEHAGGNQHRATDQHPNGDQHAVADSTARMEKAGAAGDR
jgi:osmotically-inducible protein OsmY